uniref:Zinc finger CCCH domain-containing protein 3 n=1 Tax=Oryzias latipes TaxID=8090 RepID=A0A3P9IPT0_ORYLA
MEEREALKRQIELLQNLINKHKSIHGDAPFNRAEQRLPEPSAAARGFSDVHRGSRGKPYEAQNRGSWRRTYSLKNKSPQGSGTSSMSSFSHQSTSHSIPLPSQSRGVPTNPTKSAASLPLKKMVSTAGLQGEKKKPSLSPAGGSLTHEAPKFQQRAAARQVLLPQKKERASTEVPPSSKAKSASPLFIKTTNNSCQIISAAAPLKAAHTMPTLPDLSTKHLNVLSATGPRPDFPKTSKFTWVKSQDSLKDDSRQITSPLKKAAAVTTSVSGGASGVPPAGALSKRTPPKKVARKLGPVSAATKTSKYKWVCAAGSQSRALRKVPSPKSLTPQRSLEKGDVTRKLKPTSTPPAKLKKGASGNLSVYNRYRWKAGAQGPSGAEGGVLASPLRRSAFHWTAEKSSKGMKSGLVPPAAPHRTCPPSALPGGFKLRSRMKIIRRYSSSGGSERGGGQSAVKFSPRSRLHSLIRSPAGVRRTPSRELVSFGRHKLRRLSSTPTRTNPSSSSHRSPASQRVFRTRYKMVTRPGSSPTNTLNYNPALSWRARRIHYARSFLQNRLRTPPDRHPSPSQRWARSGICWIRGSLYRVSANKLSRTANMSINRTGRLPGSSLARPSSTRHLASRAVQRSIAIIRHARQKKQQKQYCMYYNRFGKCNRGTSCTFIHDPDKVAVCTRFLRGTCKREDGTCPFSHKVSKEKMPVCSYFLKGICNNSDCPYSHVYVSSKAEVCEDFVKGYCPEGEKCKKKHTLVCSDFFKTGSCSRGSRCKLQHRQRLKRTSSTPSKRTRSKEPQKRPTLSIIMPKDAQTPPRTLPTGLLALPSFISLSSSPEEADPLDTLPADTTQVKEKKLQIKPRLRPDTS